MNKTKVLDNWSNLYSAGPMRMIKNILTLYPKEKCKTILPKTTFFWHETGDKKSVDKVYEAYFVKFRPILYILIFSVQGS
jgi:hypothetical protein